jgi:hypothetical protein
MQKRVVGVLAIILAAMVVSGSPTASSQTQQSATSTSAHGCSHLDTVYLGPSAPVYPQGTFPINGTLVREYADDLITDYNSKITHTQANNDSRYFWLYLATGQTFKVIVGLDNDSGTEQLNFLFTRISGNSPLVYPFTNETGAALRDFTAGMGPGKGVSSIYIPVCLSSGVGFEDVNTQTPYSGNRWPLIWIVNETSVYNDTKANSETAAQEMYSHDAAQIPPPPNSTIALVRTYIYGIGFKVVGFVASALGIYIAFRSRRSKSSRRGGKRRR